MEVSRPRRFGAPGGFKEGVVGVIQLVQHFQRQAQIEIGFPGVGVGVAPGLLFDGRLLVGDPLRIIRALKIDLKVNGTLEPLDRLENQLPAFPEGSCLQQLILLLRRHVEELAEHSRVLIDRLDAL